MAVGRERQIEWLQAALEKTGLTLNALAVIAGINPATLYRFESGKSDRLRAETISRIAEAIGISPPFKRVLPKAGGGDRAPDVRSDRVTRTRHLNLSVNEAVIKAASELGLNMSKAAEAGITDAIRRAQEKQWREANREAIKAYNDRIEREGPRLVADWARDLWNVNGKV